MNASVRVRVPASSANLGPGFDAFGLALQLYHDVRAETTRRDGDLEVCVAGEGARHLPRDGGNLVVRALRCALAERGLAGTGLRVHSHSVIPQGSGLGSSAAAWVAGRVAGELLRGDVPDRGRLLRLGAAAEGHGDNIAPCLFGGFTIAYHDDTGGLHCRRFEPPAGVRIVVAVPNFQVQTRAARRTLPAKVARGDAVHALAHASLLAVALATGRLEDLPAAMQDRLHEPHRMAMVPGLARVRAAAVEAGALGVALSGSGPAVLALTVAARQGEVGQAVLDAWRDAGIDGRIMTPDVDRSGVQAEVSQPE